MAVVTKPPYTDQISRIIDKLKNLTDEPWLEFELDREQYLDLQPILEKEASIHKLRYDYFSSTHTFILRVASQPHEIVVCETRSVIEALKMEIAAQEWPAATLAKKTSKSRSGKIHLDNCADHVPDGSFFYDGLKYPPVVFEVSYTQNVKELSNLAWDYILGSKGNIRVVFGIDMGKDYESATISVWRAPYRAVGGLVELYPKLTVDHEEFRDQFGKATGNPKAHLQLELKDFVGHIGLDPQIKLDIPIGISSETLCSFVDMAKKEATKITNNELKAYPLPPGVIEADREGTPPDELDGKHETQFLAAEG
ncbi:hypothetical protein MMC30_006551 [Trapelia coarctata]|nr:hypothetical protein [Trapelia coarctata]